MKQRNRIVNGELALAKKIAVARPGDCPYTLFVGAGASASSGIYTAEGMVREWQSLLYVSLTGKQTPDRATLDTWLAKEYPVWRRENTDDPAESDYAALFRHFFQEAKERQLFIEQQVDGKKPTFGYVFLAGLIAARRFNRILTTNFDDLLADALVKFYDVRPIVCAFDSAVAGIRVASHRPKVIKLHGDFLYDNVRNVGQELRRLDSNMEEKLLEMCKDAGLIVVGYAGNDDSIMDPIRLMLRKQEYLNMGVHWCLFHPAPDVPLVIPKKLEEIISAHGDRVHLYSIGGFDQLMEGMFIECGCSLPEVLLDPHRRNLAVELLEAYRRGSSRVPSAYVADCMERITEQLSTYRSSLAIEVAQAESEYQRSKAEISRGNLSVAFKLATSARDRVKAALEDMSTYNSLEIVAEAWKRLSGASLLLCDLDRQASGTNWRTYLDGALEAIQRGIVICETPEGRGIEPTIRRSFYYNSCCAFGQKHKFMGSLDERETARVREDLKKMLALDPELEDFYCLAADPDFETLRDLLQGNGGDKRVPEGQIEVPVSAPDSGPQADA